jgi:hypothetical protein
MAWRSPYHSGSRGPETAAGVAGVLAGITPFAGHTGARHAEHGTGEQVRGSTVRGSTARGSTARGRLVLPERGRSRLARRIVNGVLALGMSAALLGFLGAGYGKIPALGPALNPGHGPCAGSPAGSPPQTLLWISRPVTATVVRLSAACRARTGSPGAAPVTELNRPPGVAPTPGGLPK